MANKRIPCVPCKGTGKTKAGKQCPHCFGSGMPRTQKQRDYYARLLSSNAPLNKQVQPKHGEAKRAARLPRMREDQAAAKRRASRVPADSPLNWGKANCSYQKPADAKPERPAHKQAEGAIPPWALVRSVSPMRLEETVEHDPSLDWLPY